MNAQTILNIGRTGAGKTTAAKKIIEASNREALIYDVNNEYGKPLIEFDEFLKKGKEALNTCIVFEEATIFLSSNKSAAAMRDILVRKRHTNNVIILNFHSLRGVPTYLLELTDLIVMLQTNDNPTLINQKFKDYPEIIETFEKVNQMPQYSNILLRL